MKIESWLLISEKCSISDRNVQVRMIDAEIFPLRNLLFSTIPSQMSTTPTSLAKLTSLSTQTLSLLLERQRLRSLNQPAPAASAAQITRNLVQLRAGILALEAQVVSSNNNGNGKSARETSVLLRNQFTRMREMLGADASSVEP